MVFSYKWHAVDAKTGEPFHVGGTEPTRIMCKRTWTADLRADGWTILTPGELLPQDEAGGSIGIVYGGMANKKRI